MYIKSAKRTEKEIIDEIINYFEEKDATFTWCLEELDDCTGCLGDRRRRPMYEFDERMSSYSPLVLVELASGSWHFNSDDTYFYIDCDELRSTDEPDYDYYYLRESTIYEMLQHRSDIGSIAEDEELNALFDELEDARSD